MQVLLISKDCIVGHSFLGFSTNARVSSTAMADDARDPASGKDETEFTASEQVTFSCDECYVYKVRGTVAERSLRDRGETLRGKWTERLTSHLHTRWTYVRTFSHQIPPKRTAMGHRAEQWNVERWIREVRLKVVTQGEACRVVLVDKESDELFAVAPIPPGISIDVVVEPVLDSSRYYVLRVEDTSEGRTRHAFIGVGFCHRPHSSDFSAALYEHRRFLQKKRRGREADGSVGSPRAAFSGGLQHPRFHHREREEHDGANAEAVRHEDEGRVPNVGWEPGHSTAASTHVDHRSCFCFDGRRGPRFRRLRVFVIRRGWCSSRHGSHSARPLRPT